MKRFLLLGVLLAGALSLRADGSSGDFLISPENDATTTKQFGSSTDTLDRGGWYFEGSKGYAREKGVSLPKTTKGTLCYDFGEATPEAIYQLTVVCRTASKTYVNKELQLDVALAGTELSSSQTFTSTSTDLETTLTFTFDTLPSVTGLRFSNPTEMIYEIASIAWISTLPELTVEIETPNTVSVGSTFICALNAIKGGNGHYTLAQITFNGETLDFINPVVPLSTTFTAPSVSGDYPVKVTVQDSQGNQKTVETTITVSPYAKPTDIETQNVGRDSFDLSWKLATGASPVSYTLSVAVSPKSTTYDIVLAPDWEQDESGFWVSKDVYDLTQYTNGFRITSCSAEVFGECKSFAVLKTDATSWKGCLFLGSYYLVGALKPAEYTALRFRVKASTPPRYINLITTVDQTLLTETFGATAQLRQYTVSGMPSGTVLECSLSADYIAENGSTTKYKSDTFRVEMQDFPGFASIEHFAKWKLLQFTWPENESDISGQVKVYVANAVNGLLDPGLYLTRVLWTKSGAGLTTSKAIALTNTTTKPIQLRGNYVLQAVKRDTGTTRTWDFSETDAEGNVTYPYIIAPGEDLVVAHASYLPSDCRDTVITSKKTALNFTADWDLTLLQGSEVRNTLTPQTNAVVRLAEDSLTALEVTSVTADLPTLDPLYDAWTKVEEIQLLDTFTLQKTDSVSQFNYAPYLLTKATSRRIWASCRTLSGTYASTAENILIWEAPPVKGIIFSLR